MTSKSFTLNLTEVELRVLQELVGLNPCLSGCVWDECKEKASRVKGEQRQYDYCYWGCKFHKTQESLEAKVDSLVESLKKDDK